MSKQYRFASGSPSKRGEKAGGISAAAFQDHFSRRLNLDDGKPKRTINHPLPVVKRKEVKAKQKKTDLPSKEKDLTDILKGKNDERVLSPDGNSGAAALSKKNMSLAEKYGLLPSPIMNKEKVLSERQWEVLKRKAMVRGDIESKCPICKEDYTLFREQILLSCSHTFHKKCIYSFEKYSGKQTCPICRFENYERRLIFDGAFICSNKAALKIQSKWRAYTVRKRFLSENKDRVPQNLMLRKKFYEKKFMNMAEEIHNSYDIHSANVDSFIAEIDRNIATSKSLMENLNFNSESDSWSEIHNLALRRDNNECPICLGLLNSSKKIVLLNCSHLFHERCLASFETYSACSNHLCPVCRSMYMKKEYTVKQK
ncbi:RING finger protein 32-like [Clytia hemisphaerica]|uniref:RING-type domain-containing protein n=1 Tax=Clytia hemisphaerica TaxID=252671 RepID=A0A7M6DJG9_9CNID|eukprot:TCONS_00055591-protein